jgi:hypothetical protein
MNKLTDFAKGIIAGFLLAVIIFVVIALLRYSHNRDKEFVEYVEQEMEIEAMREEIINSDPDVFLDIPDVRRAADGAAAEFERKRDEALQRFRSRMSSGARLAD